MGGAVAVLSTQGGRVEKVAGQRAGCSDQSGDKLKELTERAQSVAQRLELMMASMHDVIPEEKAAPEPPALDVSSESEEEAEGAAEPERHLTLRFRMQTIRPPMRVRPNNQPKRRKV